MPGLEHDTLDRRDVLELVEPQKRNGRMPTPRSSFEIDHVDDSALGLVREITRKVP